MKKLKQATCYAHAQKRGLKFAYIFFVSFLGMLTQDSLAQNFFFQLDTSLEVYLPDNQKLMNAWAGGLNSPQWFAIDLNSDNTQDLVIFERTNSKFYCFLAKNQQWIYAPEYEPFFPECRGWVVFFDYDRDGKVDIFTHGFLGIKVFRNNSPTPERWNFELVADPLFSQGFSGNLNLNIPITDIPVVLDIDNDSDADILAFDVTGTYIELHQNQSIERYGNASRLEYRKVSGCWGGVQSTTNCSDYTFGLSCQILEQIKENIHRGGGGKRVKHAGNSLLLLDVNNDQKLDLLTGHISCQNLYLMLNTNTNEQAVFQNFQTNFPASRPVEMFVYPAAFWLDVDFDNRKDLIISPNLFGNEADRVNFYQSAWLYKNMGTNENPNFVYQREDFLQNTMIDLGEDASPLFVDIDADGDLDLLVSNRGKVQGNEFYATITLFENIGSKENPTFKLKNSDFLQLSARKLQGVQLYFQDFDHDQVPDLGFTSTTVSPRTTRFFFFKNTAQANQAPQFDTQNAIPLNLPISFRDNPCLVDIDQDGIIDLLVGKAEGNLVFYKNLGSNANPNYVLQTESLGGIEENSFQRDLVPLVVDLNKDGKLDLITGTNNGKISIYPNFQEKLNQIWTPETEIIANNFTQNFKSYKFGAKISPTIADYNADFRPDIAVGTNTGGVVLLKNLGSNIFRQGNANNLISYLYPNPTSQLLYFRLNETADIQLFSVLGQMVHQQKQVSAEQEYTVKVENLPAGLYLLKVQTTSGRQEVQKILIQR
ncbi:MAG: T9SS type A sorting domain-containing protein [Microscillaceae bacterium]|nr:T9SS type A sorting domain-containing protein [Microscillaceae bacterium]MDW8461460.1 T9SS type A sorting domain-containing protein [Cytophagales bacterium]